MGRRLRVLILTNLFPSHLRPTFAPFNRQQFAHLQALADVEVFAVMPWRLDGRFFRGDRRPVVRHEVIDELSVFHPRWPAVPGLPSLNAGLLSVVTTIEALRRQSARRDFDVLLASYAYPEGCAGVIAGRLLGLPVVVKCHGSDLNRVPSDPLPRFQLAHLLKRAARVVAVSQKLRERALSFGVSASRVSVVYNGVDHTRFFPRDAQSMRRELGLAVEKPVVLYVGHLAEHKGAAEFLTVATEWSREPPTFVFLGDGPLRSRVDEAARTHAHIVAPGPAPHEQVPRWMGAASCLCLPSHGEGMPNVVREAHASGRRVVATDVGGIPEAVHAPELGRLIRPRDPEALRQALVAELSEPATDPEVVRQRAIVPTWKESAAALHAVLQEAAR